MIQKYQRSALGGITVHEDSIKGGSDRNQSNMSSRRHQRANKRTHEFRVERCLTDKAIFRQGRSAQKLTSGFSQRDNASRKNVSQTNGHPSFGVSVGCAGFWKNVAQLSRYEDAKTTEHVGRVQAGCAAKTQEPMLKQICSCLTTTTERLGERALREGLEGKQNRAVVHLFQRG